MTEFETPAAAPTTEAAPTGPRTFTWGVGRRKSSVARVRITPGTGKISINDRDYNDYLTNERDRKAIFGPLDVTNIAGKIDIFPAARVAASPARPAPSSLVSPAPC